jgi:hypothetical protein
MIDHKNVNRIGPDGEVQNVLRYFNERGNFNSSFQRWAV